MSTQASRLRRISGTLVALGTAWSVYAVWSIALTLAANSFERGGHVYPYSGGETALRLLLPTLMGGSGRGRLMIMGSSTAGESLLAENLETAFPGHTAVQASFPLATLDDVLVGLEYIQRAFGTQALPDVLVLGADTRFLANKPRRFGPREEIRPEANDAYLLDTINRFSPGFRIGKTTTGSILVEKTFLERVRAWWRFWTAEQQPRHRAAVAAALNRLLNGPGDHIARSESLRNFDDIRDPLGPGSLGTFARTMSALGPLETVRAWLPAYLSPYYFHYMQHFPPDLRPDADMGVRLWKPDADDAALIISQMSRLRSLANRVGMRVVVVNIPERPSHQARYVPDDYAALLEILRTATGGMPLLDLRSLLTEAEYQDKHAGRPGAVRATAALVDFMRQQEILDR